MSLITQTDVPLAELTTFKLGGLAKKVIVIATEAELLEVFSTLSPSEKWFVVGGGSNVVFPDGDYEGTLIKIEIKGIDIIQKDDSDVTLEVGAGEWWDNVVAFAVEHNYKGIEALSAIPGTAGATPVQNVGAYGTEIKDVLVSLRAFDIEKKEIVEFTNADCQFGYRDSFFKHAGKNKFIITSLKLKLSELFPITPNYPGVKEYFAAKGILAPGVVEIRQAIIAIRASKLPDPRDIASCGSFFKNPVVPKEKAGSLKAQFPSLAIFAVSDFESKVGAGSMIDTLGYKGKKIGNFSLYSGNAVVVVHEGGGTRKELEELVQKITAEVKEKFGIELQPEPEML